jgi:hypothetical protein
MRSCDGIFSVNLLDALLTQQEFGKSGPKPLRRDARMSRAQDALERPTYSDNKRARSLKKSTTGFRRALANFFWRRGKSSAVSRLTTLAQRRRKK